MITLSLFLDDRRKKQKSRYRLYYRLYQGKTMKVHYSGYSFFAHEWDYKKQEAGKKHPEQIRVNIKISKKFNQLQIQLLDLLDEFPNLTVEEAYTHLFGEVVDSDPYVYKFCEKIEEELFSAGKQSTSRTYRGFRHSIMKFKSEDFRMSRVNFQFLKDFETHLYQRGVGPNGISVYMRSFRALINRAIKEDLFPQEKYPFKKYKIPKAPTKKRALTMDQIRQVLNADLSEVPHLIDTHNYLKFMLHMRGMNFHDMAKLKKENIQGDRIIYTRSKTGHVFDIEMSDEAKSIVDYYSRKTRVRIFPLIDEIEDENADFDIKIRSQRSRINKHLKEIAKIIKLPVNLTTYVIRHTWASLAKFQGVSSHIISESLGHANLSTTETYLASFHHSELDKTNRDLLGEIGS